MFRRHTMADQPPDDGHTPAADTAPAARPANGTAGPTTANGTVAPATTNGEAAGHAATAPTTSAPAAPGALAVGQRRPTRGQAIGEVARPIGIGALVVAAALLALWLWATFQPAVVRRQTV